LNWKFSSRGFGVLVLKICCGFVLRWLVDSIFFEIRIHFTLDNIDSHEYTNKAGAALSTPVIFPPRWRDRRAGG